MVGINLRNQKRMKCSLFVTMYRLRTKSRESNLSNILLFFQFNSIIFKGLNLI